MKLLKTLFIGTVTTLAFVGNVQANQAVFSQDDLRAAVNSNIEFNLNDINTVSVKNIAETQLSTMNLEQNVQQFLALTKLEHKVEKPAVSISAE